MPAPTPAPVPDPWRHLDQEWLAVQLIEKHKSTLAAEAVRIAKEMARARLVGLILAEDSSEATKMRQAAGPEGDRPKSEFKLGSVDYAVEVDSNG